ncbi:hypothetical protein ABIB40_002578 [Pedobacter sp. UYP30]|uniref:phosphatidylinositol-specific phospholipase C1-like protein n=1 Tax=Pedobacter sp. UYP30 TaxID=1756400 RepID=UPI00339B8A11
MKATIFAVLILAAPIFLQPLPENTPINKIQVIGSHNSYKQAIDPALFKFFEQRDSASSSKIDYEHIPFAAQLDLGLRNLEIDVYSDSLGGKYAHPKGLDWVKNQPPYDVDHEMAKSGFKIFHIQDLDFRSSALTFQDALVQLRKWSEVHPDHTPIFITLEAKDEPLSLPGMTIPEKFSQRTFDELDKVIIANLGQKHLLTPDKVRGKYKTLEEAVLKQNWPTLKEAKGTFAFILDAKGKKMETYIKDHPSLTGRVLFANADAGTPEAAMMIRNNPKDPLIPQLVKKGYIIRTRADADTQQARTDDYSDFEAAKASGAQIITTDYYLKSTHFKSDYKVSFDDGTYIKKNPLF